MSAKLAAVVDMQPAEAPTPAWPAFDVERWPIGRLSRNPRNAKKHPKAQIEQLRRLMRDYGWTQPVLARADGQLIAGHGRLEAGLAEGYTEAPVIIARGWTDEQCRLYAIADNRVTERGKWDREILNLELGELSALGFELEPIGFSIAALPGGASDSSPQLDSNLRYQILIECKDETHQAELLERLDGQGLKCKPMIS
jgi:ParB-like chromosome segregation protein Spo0J